MFLMSSQHGPILLSSTTMGERILGFIMSTWNALKSKFPRGNVKINEALVLANTGDKRVGEIHSHVASSQSLEHACVSYGTWLFVSMKVVAARSLWH